ncbi:hypothetical protein EG329_000206 [Mollisiaceae sp. DMI_Dod_QoI]|nr:hypothetical protein EG329_000206 [Helotiales sp. DMI_Dod_QoI]
MRLLLSALALLATTVCGQKMAVYTEATSGVQYSLAIPEVATAPFDVYLSMVAPINNTYAAMAFGGCMLRSPLLVAWKNDTSIVASPRWATAYHPPAPYNGTTVTVIKTSSVNATHWTANLLCTGCSSWLGGSVNSMGSATFGFGVSNHPVANPGNANSSIPFHNVNRGHFEVNITNARNSQSDFNTLKGEI